MGWTGSSDPPIFMCSLHKLPIPRRIGKKRAVLFDPQTFLASAGIGKTIHAYAAKQAIFSQGEPAGSVFYIQKGAVRISVVSEQGKEATIALLGASDFVGEECIALDQPIRTSTATATTTCSLLKIEKKEMQRTLHQEHEFSDLFVAFLLARNKRTRADLVDQLSNSSERRLARALLLLAKFGKEGMSEEIFPKVSQETLAEMIGTTRSRVNFFMNRFRKLGMIEYNEGLKVHSSLLSVVLHEEAKSTREEVSLAPAVRLQR
jgi:CRP/FNR family transcriptional regulator, cyclic AMP receptor protein